MTVDFSGDSHQSLENAIKEGHNFSSMDVIRGAIAGIDGLKFKFFLSNLIIGIIGFAFVLAAYYILPDHQDLISYSSAPNIGVSIISLFHMIINMVFVAGLSLMTLRHLRKYNNPLLDGLFSFFPLIGRVVAICVILGIFLLAIPMIMILFVSSLHSEVLSLVVLIMMLLMMFGISLLYSLVFFIMADNPTMGFWQVMESSRKLVMNRFLKMGILYIILTIVLVLFSILVMFVSGLIFSPLLMSVNPFTISAAEMIFLLMLPYLPIVIFSLWLVPFCWLVPGLIYLNLINDPSVKKRATINRW